MKLNLDLFATEIGKTGFKLENDIAQVLKAADWTVISHRYYVDDTDEKVREIDILAYKASAVKDFHVYTALIVSCKKNEKNAWALLARDIKKNDPNADWWPLHTWSNDKVLNFLTSDSEKKRDYHDQVRKKGVCEALCMPPVEIFAYQEMRKDNGSPQNDKAIFSAITSLMKAQAYEIAKLPSRQKNPSVYQFNLLSIVDSEIVRLMFKESNIEPKLVDTEQYLARYIIQHKETIARIRFIKSSAFRSELKNYDQLHQANCKWFMSQYDEFYNDPIKDEKRVAVLIDDFRNQIKWQLSIRIKQQLKEEIDFGEPSVYWSKSPGYALVGVNVPPQILEFLNNDAISKRIVAAALKMVFRYQGNFRFDEDIPF